jgi:hypothetical protein
MSGKLITREEPHSYRDDLESTIYVLLWVALMFSETSQPMNVALFMDTVLDPKMPAGIGEDTSIYPYKAEFLTQTQFLKFTKFPGRPCFHTLLTSLADLFAVRYEKVPIGASDLPRARKILDSFTNKIDQELFRSLPLFSYFERMAFLTNHDRTIELFNIALQNRSEWPVDDRAEKQHIRKGTEYPIRSQVTKASWISVYGTQGIGPQAMDVDGEAMDANGEAMDEAMVVDGWTASGAS